MTSTEKESDVWTHREALINGVRLHYVEAIPPRHLTISPPLIILLHGFPEFWYSWRHQIPALADAGFHVIAPDMRGYNTSGKPRGARHYDIRVLCADIARLVHHFGAERAVVVGHDWGGMVAWFTPMLYPQLVEKLIVLNAPHPAAFLREMKTPAQFFKSSYQFFFQLPWLPEATLRARNFALLKAVLRREPVRRNAFTRRDIRLYVQALARPGALTATLNYYRAIFRRGPSRALHDVRRIDIPTLLIWGEQDRYLGPNLTRGLEKWVPDIHIERLPQASHWVQNDAPERVNELMLEFLRKRVD